MELRRQRVPWRGGASARGECAEEVVTAAGMVRAVRRRSGHVAALQDDSREGGRRVAASLGKKREAPAAVLFIWRGRLGFGQRTTRSWGGVHRTDAEGAGGARASRYGGGRVGARERV